MMFNDSIRYVNNTLHCDQIPVSDILQETGSPVYIYSLPRALNNLERIRTAFSTLQPHIHYSAKANASLAVLKALVDAGAGIDAVSAGEIHKALASGASPQNIVFAGVGKTRDELLYALQAGVGWFNVENVEECSLLNQLASELNTLPVQIALRLNPQVTADTHPYIATGHGGAKFGLTADTVSDLLAHQVDYPHLNFAGIHLHIGSQLHDTEATVQAVKAALRLIQPYPQIRTINIGGGLPVAYHAGERAPDFVDFANTLESLLKDYTVLLEPGRSVIADAGLLIATVTYVKQQAGQIFYITDASMAELIRPALYQAHHTIVPLIEDETGEGVVVQVVGPVCETTDVLGRDVVLPRMQPGDALALLTAGAYGMVMASNYNARLRPPEVVINPDGASWRVARQRETWADLLHLESI